MLNRILAACALTAALFGAAAAQTPAMPQSRAAPPPAELPEMSSAMVNVPWSELRPLLRAYRPEEEKEEEPPVAFSLASARYEAGYISGMTMRVQARYEVSVWREAGWVMVPLIGDAVAPRSVTVDGAPASLTKADGGYLGILLTEAGQHAVELEFLMALRAQEATVHFEFKTVPTPITELTLRLPPRNKGIAAPASAGVDEQAGEDALVARISYPPADSIAAHWPLPLPPEDAPSGKPQAEARVAAAVETLATLTGRFLSCRTRIEYEVLAGTVNVFRIALPEAVDLLSVTGPGAEVSEAREEGRLLLRVAVNHAISQNYALDLRYEMAAAPGNGEPVKAPLPEPLGVARSTGHVAVTAWGPVRVDSHAPAEGLRRTDPAELPAALRARASRPVLMAFRYHEAPPPLALDAEKLRDVAVRVAQADRANVITVLDKSGLAVTRATYEVRNNSQQFLRMRLPEGAEVLAAEVGGEPVKPAYEGDDESVILLPLRSVPAQASAGLPCSITYREQAPALSGLRSSYPWSAPLLGLMTSQFRWTVYLPEDRVLLSASGDLDRVQESGRQRGLGLRQAADYRPGFLPPLREGVERFFITDINNPAAADLGGGPRTFDDDSPRGEPVSLAPVAGMLPVRISLPQTGRAYVFTRALTAEDQAVSMTITTVPRGSGRVGLAAASVAAGLAAFWLTRWAMRRYRWWLGAGVLLGVAAVAAILLRGSAAGLWAALGAGAGVALAAGLQALRRRTNVRAGQEGAS